METGQLKNYAPQARRDFIEGVKNRAAVYGLLPKEILPMKEEGDVVIIGDRPFPRSVAKQRKELEERIRREGFNHFIEAIAYTWFNRFVAIRFMELHGYLDHSYRVLSHPEGKSTPQILENAERVELPGLNRDKVVELKLDGTQDEALYRLLLLAQCNALHQAMPFLFEKIGDADELLLPANLLHTDSLIRQLVEQVDEQSWQQIEIIGWLYQFYISEKKDQVIGKVVKSEDIPAATQLFTPNWIVKYLVQNSLGAQWLATYPDSRLKAQMEYYIEPVEQTDEVNSQLAAMTPNQLNPEALTLIDPACGSGHILVEAYELFKAIYLERGYRQRDVPQLILEKNLFGLDIDERAAQLTGFALMMKGRADDRRLFERGVKLNVMAMEDSAGFDAEVLAKGVELSDYGLKTGDLMELKRLFEHATTFGSLIQVPEGFAEKLPALKQLSGATSQDLFVSEALKQLGPLVRQAELLAAQYNAVVANPPYMGSKYQVRVLKNFANSSFSASKGDLFACFIERGYTLAHPAGFNAMVTMQSWMFLSSYEQMRERLVQDRTIAGLAHLGNGVMIGFGTTAFILRNTSVLNYLATYFYVSTTDLGVNKVPSEVPVRNSRFSIISQDRFKQIPGVPIGYWVSRPTLNAFESGKPIGEILTFKQGMATSDNERFLRQWVEVSHLGVDLSCETPAELGHSQRKWFPYSKGGTYRKWYGNNDLLVNWEHDGQEMKAFTSTLLQGMNVRLKSREYYCLPSLTYSTLALSFGCRMNDNGFVFDVKGSCIFGSDADRTTYCGFLNTSVARHFLEVLCPTLDFQMVGIRQIPILSREMPNCVQAVKRARQVSKHDWDAYERSWDFQCPPLLAAPFEPTPTVESGYTAWITQNREIIAEMKRLEEENNRLFIDAYGLSDELTPNVPIEQITLTVNPAYRYGGKLTEEELWTRFRQDTMGELVSYAIGCMMGRYSLDAPGLIYAHSGNEGFDPSRYTTFPADDDAIIPLTDTEWFDDDAAKRLVEFISVAWDESHLEANLCFLADNLNPKKSESSRETIRRYLCDSFFKDHMQTYKKRPIYWLFSSGKQKAFQCLVYLHRYNEGTLARMRTKYVVPFQGKLNARIEQLESDIPAAGSTSHRKRLETDRTRLIKQREELQRFDEKLRHCADQRIHLDLDDGVKVNYAKFGDLLAEVKAITGGKSEE